MNDEERLALTPTDDIIKELGNRYEHFVFSGMQTAIGGKDKILTTRKWQGNSATCIGLAHMLTNVIYDDHQGRNELNSKDPYP